MMRRITVLTPDNIEIEYRLAGLGSRAAAAAIDCIVQAFIISAITVPIIYIFYGRPGAINNLNSLGWAAGIIIAVFFTVFFGYHTAAEMLYNGRTAGKILFGLRAVRENGMPVSVVHSLIRNAFKLTVDILGPGILLILFTKKQKRIGDIAASTVVIVERPAIKPPRGKLSRTPNDGIHIYGADMFLLSSAEKILLTEYFSRKDTFTDGGESVKIVWLNYIAEKFGIPAHLLTDDMLLHILRMNGG